MEGSKKLFSKTCQRIVLFYSSQKAGEKIFCILAFKKLWIFYFFFKNASLSSWIQLNILSVYHYGQSSSTGTFSPLGFVFTEMLKWSSDSPQHRHFPLGFSYRHSYPRRSPHLERAQAKSWNKLGYLDPYLFQFGQSGSC